MKGNAKEKWLPVGVKQDERRLFARNEKKRTGCNDTANRTQPYHTFSINVSPRCCNNFPHTCNSPATCSAYQSEIDEIRLKLTAKFSFKFPMLHNLFFHNTEINYARLRSCNATGRSIKIVEVCSHRVETRNEIKWNRYFLFFSFFFFFFFFEIHRIFPIYSISLNTTLFKRDV